MSKQMLGSKPIKIYFHFGPQTFIVINAIVQLSW